MKTAFTIKVFLYSKYIFLYIASLSLCFFFTIQRTDRKLINLYFVSQVIALVPALFTSEVVLLTN